MQLKIRRSQRDAGMLSSSVMFSLDARVEFSPEERSNILRYGLSGQVIYNSDAQKRLLDKSASQRDGSFGGGLRSFATLALAAVKMNITIASLERGQRIECKSMDELLGAEEAIMQACENLKGYLALAQTFDGREVLIDFSSNEPQVVAQTPALPSVDSMPRATVTFTPIATPADTAPSGDDEIGGAPHFERAPRFQGTFQERMAALAGTAEYRIFVVVICLGFVAGLVWMVVRK
jgi:hypothetical protein